MDTQIHYQGKKWDAPMTDGAIQVSYMTGKTCVACQELITAEDNAILNTWANQPHHLECYLRGAFGDVAHLEGRCGICDGTEPRPLPSDEYPTYRESAKTSLQWVIDHRKGRFHD